MRRMKFGLGICAAAIFMLPILHGAGVNESFVANMEMAQRVINGQEPVSQEITADKGVLEKAKQVMDALSKANTLNSCLANLLKNTDASGVLVKNADKIVDLAAALEKITGFKPVANPLLEKALQQASLATKIDKFTAIAEKYGTPAGIALNIVGGCIDIAKAETADEKAKALSRLLARLSADALAGAIAVASEGKINHPLLTLALEEIFVSVISYYNDHPELNGFAILINKIYDSGVPEALYEWWYDMRYKDAILQDRKKGDVNDNPGNGQDPFNSNPNNPGGNTGDGTGNGTTNGSGKKDGYQGLKPIHLF